MSQRLAILEVLAKSEAPPTANQVLRRVQRRFPMVGKGPVYTPSSSWKELGQVPELEFRDAANRYDGRHGPHLRAAGVPLPAYLSVLASDRGCSVDRGWSGTA